MKDKIFKTFVLLISAFLTINAESELYKSYKVYETIPQNVSQLQLLRQLSQIWNVFDFWKLSKIPGDSAHIMVPPEYQPDFEDALYSNGMDFTVLIQNVAESFKNIYRNTNDAEIDQAFGVSPLGLTFTNFHRFNDINGYLDDLAKSYSNRVKVIEVGKSYEGRSMKTITITNGDNNPRKKTIFIDAGIHAREWIAPATALFIINQLVENFNENKNLLEKFNWIILPVVNPDGYEYTHTRERLWRKTRKPNRMCAGVDGNRNFGYHWGETGASSNECSDTYKGPSPFSEPETQIVRKIIQAEKGRCKFYLTLHSYGQYLLYPWGWTSQLPSTWKDLDEVAQAGASAIHSATGSRYTVGSSTNVLYAAAGGSDDYAFNEGIPISITMELPGSSFSPPASQIRSMVSEAWIGIKAMVKKVNKNTLNKIKQK